MVSQDKDADGEHYTVGVPFPYIKFLRQDFPQYSFAQLMSNNNIQVTAKSINANGEDKKFIEESGVFYAEPELLRYVRSKVFEWQG